MASLTAVAQIKGDAATRGEMREMVKPGHKVFVIFDDKTGDFDEKSEYIVEFLIQDAVYRLSTGQEIRLVEDDGSVSPTNLIIMYDAEVGKDALLQAVKDYGAELRGLYLTLSRRALSSYPIRPLSRKSTRHTFHTMRNNLIC